MSKIEHKSNAVVTRIIFPMILRNPINNRIIETSCLLDTGANVSAVTLKAIEDLHLSKVENSISSSAFGMQETTSYYVEACLKSDMRFKVKAVGCSCFPESLSIGFILGMDIISQGDLLISNSNNYTFMSFTIIDK